MDAYVQWGHLYGRSPTWMRMCRFRWLEIVVLKLQWVQCSIFIELSWCWHFIWLKCINENQKNFKESHFHEFYRFSRALVFVRYSHVSNLQAKFFSVECVAWWTRNSPALLPLNRQSLSGHLKTVTGMTSLWRCICCSNRFLKISNFKYLSIKHTSYFFIMLIQICMFTWSFILWVSEKLQINKFMWSSKKSSALNKWMFSAHFCYAGIFDVIQHIEIFRARVPNF